MYIKGTVSRYRQPMLGKRGFDRDDLCLLKEQSQEIAMGQKWNGRMIQNKRGDSNIEKAFSSYEPITWELISTYSNNNIFI